MSIEILTFGCRLNAYESEVMREHAQKAGLENAIVVNTCAVTKEAERQAKQAIRRARKANPDAKLIVTGCAAQVHPESFAAMPEVDVVLGNEEKLKGDEWRVVSGAEQGQNEIARSADRASPERVSLRSGVAASIETKQEEKIRVNDIMEVKEVASHMVTAFTENTRAFVQVQNGCDHRCTFCIIPYGRGNSRSVPVAEVVAQVRLLVAGGVKEVVLTGVDISDYGNGLPGSPTLGNLVRRILKLVPELPRLRISSIDAVEMDDDLWRALAEEERLMPHLHLSLQAGDDMVLKRMKRRHNRSDILRFAEKARALRPDIVFGADIIAGFPTETDAMFDNSLRIVEEAGLTWLHVFPYSAREGTPAARMPQVEKQVRKDRAAALRKAGEKQAQLFLKSQIGQTRQVLVEKGGLGHTEHFAPVKIDSALPGELHHIYMKSERFGHLVA